jgi:Zn-dependent metalloprotease
MSVRRAVLVLLVCLLPLAAIAERVRLIPLTRQPVRVAAVRPAPAQLTARQQQLFERVREARRRVGAAAMAADSRRTAALMEAGGKRRSGVRTVPSMPAAVATGAAVEIHMGSGAVPRLLRSAERSGGRRLPLQAAVPVLAFTAAANEERTARAFLNRHRGLLRLDDPDRETALAGRAGDDLGQRHLRFAQTHRGLPVWPAELIVHLDAAGSVAAATGGHVPSPQNLDVEPALAAEEAAEAARRHAEAGADAETGPAALIVYAPQDAAPRLAWKVDVNVSLRRRWTVLVDARDGSLLDRYSRVQEEAVPGSGTDLFGVERDLNVWRDGGSYYLTDTGKPMYDPASAPPLAANVRGAIIVSDAANHPPNSDPQTIPPTTLVSSSSATDGWLADGVSAAAGLSAVYDYYRECHSRDSVDGKGGNILSVVRLGKGYDNAFWASDLNSMFFGDADVYAGALDVVAHELTHGVTSYSANLLYQGQAGALNEAFSDIFGEMVEAHAAGSRDGSCSKGLNDWQIGTSLNAGAFRDLKNPGRLDSGLGPYPSDMDGYVRTKQDYGGVHINSSIINHAYYLLAEGLDGAIGLRDAERIFYRALTVYLTLDSHFADARLACEQSAEDLFGADSVQLAKTREAFETVKIGTAGGGGGGNPVGVEGSDSMVFVFPFQGQEYLGRREFPRDPSQGVDLSFYGAARSRPSVTANGKVAAYVSSNRDFCMVPTAKPYSDACLGLAGEVHSVAMSGDGNTFAFVLMDLEADPPRPENRIVLFRIGQRQTEDYALLAPATEGILIDSVVQANAMTFAVNGRYLVYDALNRIDQDGAPVEAWSIYAIDLVLQQTRILVPPVLGLDIMNPALGLLSDDDLTFEAVDRASLKSSIYVTRLSRSVLAELQPVATATVSDSLKAMPSFAGDDRALYYSDVDDAPSASPVGRSIYRQPLKADDGGKLVADGAAAVDLSAAEFAVIYRRGVRYRLNVKRAGPGDGQVTDSTGEIDCGFTCSDLYPKGTKVTLTAQPAFNSTFAGWRGACEGWGECRVTMRRRRSVTAVFRPYQTLAIAKTGEGLGYVSTIPDGIACEPGCSAAESLFPWGHWLVLTAVPEEGSEFVGWGGACRGKSLCSLKMNKARNVTAKFRQKSPAGQVD